MSKFNLFLKKFKIYYGYYIYIYKKCLGVYGEKIWAMGLAAYCNYLLKKKFNVVNIHFEFLPTLKKNFVRILFARVSKLLDYSILECKYIFF